jgi:hypothetical protein
MFRFLTSQRAASSVAGQAAVMRMRMYSESAFRPRFEFMNINDDPTKGFMLRAAVDEKRVILTYFPQLGPRKSDPNDPAPQFDFAARRSIRLFQHEVAGVLTVCEGKASKHAVATINHDLSFEQLENNGFTLQGTVSKKSNPVPWGIRFEGYQATMLRHFMSSALEESFGFRKHFAALQADEARRSTRGRGNGSSDQGGYQRGRGRGYGSEQGSPQRARGTTPS